MKLFHVFVVMLALPMAAQAFAQSEGDLKVKVKGFVDSYHAVRTEGDRDWMASRTRARGELTLGMEAASVYVSMNALYNAVLPERTGLELREAFISYQKGGLDVRAGRQIVVWGVADALRVTDLVSPFDYTEFLAQDYDDIRIPVGALRVKYGWNLVNFDVICVPVPEFFVLPTEGPWAVPAVLGVGERPAKKLANMEFGGRMTVNLSALDFSVCALRTWEKMPVEGRYPRQTMVGGDVSLPAGAFVLRGEAAWYSLGGVKGLAGVDWYAGRDWNVSVQYSHQGSDGMATARVSKELLRSMLKLSTFAYVDVTNGGVFNRLSAAYAVSDQVEVTAGYDYFYADRGLFALYKRNSEVWGKVKYSF